jgi:hypothetical protein
MNNPNIKLLVDALRANVRAADGLTKLLVLELDKYVVELQNKFRTLEEGLKQDVVDRGPFRAEGANDAEGEPTLIFQVREEDGVIELLDFGGEVTITLEEFLVDERMDPATALDVWDVLEKLKMEAGIE